MKRSYLYTLARIYIMIPRTFRNVLIVTACSSALFSVHACTQKPNSTEIAVIKQALEEAPSDVQDDGQQLFDDGASAQAVSITWDDQESNRRGNVLNATITNNTGSKIKVDIKVLAVGPNGQIVTRPLGNRVLQEQASHNLRVPIGDLPIQSVGVSTAVTIVASYPGPSVNPLTGEAITPLTLDTFAIHRHITFDTDFSQATIRSEAAQIEHNLPAYDDTSSPGLTALRVYDSKTDAVQPASITTADDGQPAAVVRMLTLPPGSLESDIFNMQTR
jgi:hypothetical protein